MQENTQLSTTLNKKTQSTSYANCVASYDTWSGYMVVLFYQSQAPHLANIRVCKISVQAYYYFKFQDDLI